MRSGLLRTRTLRSTAEAARERRELTLALGALRAQARIHGALSGALGVAAGPLGRLLRRCDLAAHLDEILLSGGTGDVGDAGATGDEEQPNDRQPGDETPSGSAAALPRGCRGPGVVGGHVGAPHHFS